MTDERGDVRLLPNPHTHNPPFQSQHQHQQQPQPIPVQLPNIYINPPLPQPQLQPHLQPQVEQHERQHDLGRDQRPRAEGTDHRHYQLNGPVPTPGPTVRMVKIGPFRFTKPHPLLWISLALSLIALVLEVPKGSLPTLTGRHKVLRNQERLVQERLHLLSRLSTFLPPPLASMIDPQPHTLHSNSHPSSSGGSITPNSLEMLRFWNNHENAQLLNLAGSGTGGGGGGERWWSVEELGQGASVVRSKGDGSDREVWVLKVGESPEGHNPLMNALTHSLLLRDRLLSELTHLKSQSPTALITTPDAIKHASRDHRSHDQIDQEGHEQGHGLIHARAEREAERRRRERERERQREEEVEEREREVGRREKWVIEEMRKLTDKVHAEASELTLEDRITERLQTYQRQLSKISEEREKEL